MNETNKDEKINEQINEKIPTLEQLHLLGFKNEREYKLYLELKKSLQQKVPVGIAS